MRSGWMAWAAGACWGVVVCALPASGDEARVIFESARETLEVLPNLVDDGGFEKLAGARVDWRGYGKGYEIDRSVKHSGDCSIRCRALDISSTFGAVQRVALKQREARPVVVEVWTRCEGTEFPASSEYSLYCDLTYADGSREFGVLTKCPTDARAWERVELVLQPTRAIAAIDLYCLFRGTAGTAWFDDVACREVDPARVRMFDGEIVRQVAMPTRLVTTQPSWMDGLVLLIQTHDDGRIWEPAIIAGDDSLKVNFELRGFTATVTHEGEGRSARIHVVTASESSSREPLTLICGRSIGSGGKWWDDGRRSRAFEAPTYGSFGFGMTNQVYVGCGKSGWYSRYPISAVSADGKMHAMRVVECLSSYVGVDRMEFTRLGYDIPLGFQYVAWDFIAPWGGTRMGSFFDPELSIYEGNGESWDGPSSLWSALHACENDRARPKLIGIWAPFVKISTIERPDDFGFAFKEGDNDLEYDKQHGIQSFQYAYPQAAWAKLANSGSKNYSTLRDEIAVLAAASQPDVADLWSALKAACVRADGRDYLWPVDAPWCRGAVLATSPIYRGHFLRSTEENSSPHETKVEQASDAQSKPQIGGLFFDSVDAFADIIDFGKLSGIEPTDTFDPRTRRRGVLNAVYMSRYYQSRNHWAQQRGRRYRIQAYFTMANGCPTRYWWMVPLFDVMGQEVNWKVDGVWAPMSAEEMWYRRALCGKKPYCLLMNSDFDRWTVEDTRRYFMRCAAYGFFPSFFSHNAYDKNYWEQPAWYNRDRPVFKQFIPVLQTIGRAGWEPVTWGRSDLPREILVERFAAGDAGPQYWTVHNPTDATVRGRVWLARGRVEGETLREMLSGGEKRGVIEGGELRIDVELRAGETWVLR